MKVLRLDSVVFETGDLPRLREFYVGRLGLSVGSFEKDGETRPDENESYFNLAIAGTLLGFETGEPQTGTVVLKVEDLTATRDYLRAQEIPVVRGTDFFVIVQDPDGREIILQAD